MSDPYSYDYDDDINPYVNDTSANLDDVDLNAAPPRNLPPPPTVVQTPAAAPSIKINKPEEVKPEPKKQKAPPKTKELTGIRQKKLFGFAHVGNLPFPLINPNYFTYVIWSGHWITVPVAFAEIFLCIFVLLLNLLGQWFHLGATIETSTSWAPYIVLRIVWAHVVLCLVPWVVFAKYAAIFRACTEANPMVKAPLYLMFLIFTILTTIFYVAMWTGGVGSGLFTSIFFLVAGLARGGGVGIFTLVYAGYDFLVSFIWVLLIIFSIIEVGGMARNYYLYKRARAQAKAAMNAV